MKNPPGRIAGRVLQHRLGALARRRQGKTTDTGADE